MATGKNHTPPADRPAWRKQKGDENPACAPPGTARFSRKQEPKKPRPPKRFANAALVAQTIKGMECEYRPNHPFAAEKNTSARRKCRDSLKENNGKPRAHCSPESLRPFTQTQDFPAHTLPDANGKAWSSPALRPSPPPHPSQTPLSSASPLANAPFVRRAQTKTAGENSGGFFLHKVNHS